MTEQRLKDRIALITGASRGIGRAIAFGYAREGASIAATARTENELDSLVKEIGTLGKKAIEYDAHRLGVRVEDLEGSITPIGRRLEPEEIVPLAVLLASDESAAITGQAFNTCGGAAMF